MSQSKAEKRQEINENAAWPETSSGARYAYGENNTTVVFPLAKHSLRGFIHNILCRMRFHQWEISIWQFSHAPNTAWSLKFCKHCGTAREVSRVEAEAELRRVIDEQAPR